MTHPLDSIKHEIFNFDLDTARLKLALLKENFEYRIFYEKFINSMEDTNFSFPAYNFEKFGLPGVRFIFGGPSHFDLLKFLDPLKDFDIDQKREELFLQKIFYQNAVMQLEVDSDLPFEGMGARTMHTLKKTKPYERFFAVDLRKKKKQIIREFEEFLNNSYRWKKFLGIDTWELDNSRFRAEAWSHLKIWQLRRKKLSFSKIAMELKLTEDNAKKSFYRAYELTQGRKYNLDLSRKEIGRIKLNELQKTCGSCPDRNTCGNFDLCPEILSYVDQDTLKHTKEKLIPIPHF